MKKKKGIVKKLVCGPMEHTIVSLLQSTTTHSTCYGSNPSSNYVLVCEKCGMSKSDIEHQRSSILHDQSKTPRSIKEIEAEIQATKNRINEILTTQHKVHNTFFGNLKKFIIDEAVMVAIFVLLGALLTFTLILYFMGIIK